ncbi:MAG: hypothetical protein RQ754_08160 [Desulfuromonadales bacterium]|nr:hypothetical protein [Desulfuromonadales bacterium]
MVSEHKEREEAVARDPVTTHRRLQQLYNCVLVVGLHSICLGLFIFFFTNSFYDFFFRTSVDNFFFVQQSGLFLFCLGLFYLIPLCDLTRFHRLIDITITTKILAVFFLAGNAHLVPNPGAIMFAAAVDAAMGGMLIYFSRSCGLLLKK